jgi:hypothetical protein
MRYTWHRVSRAWSSWTDRRRIFTIAVVGYPFGTQRYALRPHPAKYFCGDLSSTEARITLRLQISGSKQPLLALLKVFLFRTRHGTVNESLPIGRRIGVEQFIV